MAVLSCRHGLGFDKIRSDCAPVCGPAGGLIAEFGKAVKWMRDPTRGGLATVLNELAVAAGAAIEINEEQVPVEGAVADGADILGLDPLYMACEGRLVAVVDAAVAEAAVRKLRKESAGAGSAAIGAVTGIGRADPQVQLNTKYGNRRILRYLAADQQPRIC
jgi:hydrogenase expression/formation protein HypE